jgi:hypothetical protein
MHKPHGPVSVSKHALARFRERLDPWADRFRVARAFQESRPLNIQEKRDLQDVLFENCPSHQRRQHVDLTEDIFFHEPLSAVFFTCPFERGSNVRVIKTVIRLKV